MKENLNFDEKFSALGEYYNINSPEEIKNQIKNNENIFEFLEEIKPYLEESFSDADFSLRMNFEPETAHRFIILSVNVSKDRYNNGIGDEIRLFDIKTKFLRKDLNLFHEVLVFPGRKNV